MLLSFVPCVVASSAQIVTLRASQDDPGLATAAPEVVISDSVRAFIEGVTPLKLGPGAPLRLAGFEQLPIAQQSLAAAATAAMWGRKQHQLVLDVGGRDLLIGDAAYVIKRLRLPIPLTRSTGIPINFDHSLIDLVLSQMHWDLKPDEQISLPSGFELPVAACAAWCLGLAYADRTIGYRTPNGRLLVLGAPGNIVGGPLVRKKPEVIVAS